MPDRIDVHVLIMDSAGPGDRREDDVDPADSATAKALARLKMHPRDDEGEQSGAGAAGVAGRSLARRAS